MSSPVERIRHNLDASISAKQHLMADSHTLAGFALCGWIAASAGL